MELNTASAVISFARKLEEDSARFYEDLSRRYIKDKDVLQSFAKENAKNITHIERTYYGVITDALEGCFTFNIDPDNYAFKTEPEVGAGYSKDLGKAIEIEEKVIRFYSDAAEQSKSLMADVPRAFVIVAKKRSTRKSKLESLLDKDT
jgi:hypothetical protein